MDENRFNSIEIFYKEEVPVIIEEYFKEFSQEYTRRYSALSTVDTKNGSMDLFTFIENYFKETYNIPYQINKHFDLHTTALFYAPAVDFGLSTKPEYYAEYRKVLKDKSAKGQHLSPSFLQNRFGIYRDFSGTYDISSKVVKKKIEDDVNLELQLIKLRLKSSLKRFFLQGQVKWEWIVADQLKFYGVDKFTNCLNNEFSQLEYSIEFEKKYGHLGSSYYYTDNTLLSDEDEEKIQNLEREYYTTIEKKNPSTYNYKDVIEKHLLQHKINHIRCYFKSKSKNFVSIKTSSEDLGEIPLLSFTGNNSLIIKPDKNEVYQEYLSYTTTGLQSDLKPYEFPINFNLSISDVCRDENIIQEYLNTYNEPENGIRDLIGLPRIGEGWISETNLYYEIKSKFNEDIVIHHGRPSWLGRQHLDIYLPKYNIGVEYQGDQHYRPIEFFGGEKSFKKNRKRDKQKKELCSKNNCHLIYVNPGYDIDNVLTQIESHMRK